MTNKSDMLPFRLPSAAEVSPALRHEREKLEKMLADREPARSEFEAIETRLAATDGPDYVMVDGRPVRRLVSKILGHAVPEVKSANPVEDRARAAELRDLVDAYDEAIEVQRDKVDDEHAVAVAKISKLAAPENEKRARLVCERLLALRAAVIAYDDLWRDLLDARAAGELPCAKFLALGDPTSRYSFFAEFLHCAVTRKLWTRAEIPGQLKLAPGEEA